MAEENTNTDDELFGYCLATFLIMISSPGIAGEPAPSSVRFNLSLTGKRLKNSVEGPRQNLQKRLSPKCAITKTTKPSLQRAGCSIMTFWHFILKHSKTMEDYQGKAPTPTALESGSDVVEEEIFGHCLNCMQGSKKWVCLVMEKTIETQEPLPRRTALASKG